MEPGNGGFSPVGARWVDDMGTGAGRGGATQIHDAAAGGDGVIPILLVRPPANELLHYPLPNLEGGTMLKAPRSLTGLLGLAEETSGSAELPMRPSWRANTTRHRRAPRHVLTLCVVIPFRQHCP
uniref:Uncharacterized protein n=1 Tax=Oryza brachyantha TaxID=4533 RepID=J3LRU2_ORYBR